MLFSLKSAVLHIGLALVLVAGLTGCAGMRQGAFLPLPETESQFVLESLRQKEHTIRTLRGLFRASISGSGLPFSQDFNGMVSYVNPNRVHLQGFLRIGVPIMDFHREGSRYQLYFPAENNLITGQIGEEEIGNQWDQTVHLSIRALDAVLGKIEGLSREDISVSKSPTHYRLDMEARPAPDQRSEGRYHVRTWVDVQTLELAAIEYWQSSDDVIVSVECEDYQEVNMPAVAKGEIFRLPFVVNATDHRPNGGSLTLQFQELILNAPS